MTIGSDFIRVRGARTHNLQNLNLDVPKGALVVVTGPSGSGKSSLAFDTLFAEGQRRYVESLSAYARQFLELMERPDCDWIEGLAPAIAIEQKSASHHPRSTVGTVTEIHDYLRVLYARIGEPRCPEHPELQLEALEIAQMVDRLSALPEGTALLVLAPTRLGVGETLAERFAAWRAQGFTKARLDRALIDLDAPIDRSSAAPWQVELLIDRLRLRAGSRERLAEALETACRLGAGRVLVVEADSGGEHAFSTRHVCPRCEYTVPELEPRLFSFNSPLGACPVCDGLGERDEFDPARIVAHPELSLASGAIAGWDRRSPFYFRLIGGLAAHYGFDCDTPWQDLPEQVRRVVLYGSGEEAIEFTDLDERGRTRRRREPFEGVIPILRRRFRDTAADAVREELKRFMTRQPCTACGGSRLRREARYVFVGGASLPEVESWPLAQALAFFEGLSLEGARRAIADRLLESVRRRLRFLVEVGLDYLTLDRRTETLSGGEAQRIRLASQLGSGLTGVMYVLDEPSIGLHPRDNARLITTLRELRDLGNTVIVVEHDEETIRAADHVIDLGPGAGVHGGRIVGQGTPEAIARTPGSVTGPYLSGARQIPLPRERCAPRPGQALVVRGARGHNLKDLDVTIPLGLFVCVTGVSGSGKSTLVNDTLYRAIARRLGQRVEEPAPHRALEGSEAIEAVVNIDQSPIGRTPRSNPATYTGLFTPIRELFAQTAMARERGYGPGRFSFNVKGGRCEACEGDGVRRVSMHFLPDLYVPCDQCGGQRYNRETLEVRYRGRNIAEVLAMTVSEAHEFFAAVPAVAGKLALLEEVGLGYLELGQSATTLSGGEAQRLKLALELARREVGRTLYILDEPTTGLHLCDIELLLKVLLRLRDRGNTIVVIEHHLEVIKTADWVIDLGPEAGAGGGRLVACGPPETIASTPGSHTGRFLAPVLARTQANARSSAAHTQAVGEALQALTE
ncbi:MAG: excinuclease ABC subunit UvrA [Casimicrobiaceae bacterium]|nr:excinuclease ABC subunit UvrA [Casimicrobiaceae bacterium]MCX8099019.1 excinuclease ABC subunit UvrA [Casimicrobiaceae bacterium]